MTWTYSGDPSLSTKDQVRFLVGDTDTAEQLIADEEINFLLATWANVAGSTIYVAAMAAEAIAAKFAREASYNADGTSVSLSELQSKYANLAVALRAQHSSLLVGGIPDVGGIDPYEEPDPFIAPFIFGTGMHDDLEAGQQDFGHRGATLPYSPEQEPGY